MAEILHENLMLRAYMEEGIETKQETNVIWAQGSANASVIDELLNGDPESAGKQLRIGSEGYFIPHPDFKLPYALGPYESSSLLVGYGELTENEIFVVTRPEAVLRNIAKVLFGAPRRTQLEIGVSEAKVKLPPKDLQIVPGQRHLELVK